MGELIVVTYYCHRHTVTVSFTLTLTSVAVLCHELPHEIGDFAMLLKAGMTIKQVHIITIIPFNTTTLPQAIFYNVLSSILAFLGMVSGLLLATSLPSFTPWLFAATAGIFLYVALVDMMPELSSGHAHPISKWVAVVVAVFLVY